MVHRVLEKIKSQEGAVFWGLFAFLLTMGIAGVLQIFLTRQPSSAVTFEKQAFSVSSWGERGDHFVASKNGSKYYPFECAMVKRIKEENRIYFATVSDAESAGFSKSTACK